MDRVNLFTYAFGELSQDAALSWLLAWASPDQAAQDDAMHRYGAAFLAFIYRRCGQKLGEVSSIAVKQQDQRIDVQCIVNDRDIVLIEDKAGTKQHSDQLTRYTEALAGTGKKIIPVYIQTRDQSDYKAVTEAGYSVITRGDLLGFFHEHAALQKECRNSILDDFVAHLEEIEGWVQSYLNLPLEDWYQQSWAGFYQELQTRLGDGHWDYVPNTAGGFMGFWWYFDANEECEYYLQLEEGKFCFKIDCNTREECRELMWKYRDHLVAQGQAAGLDVVNPPRLRAGVYTTVAVLGSEYRVCRADGLIDMDATVERLRKIMEFFTAAIEALPRS